MNAIFKLEESDHLGRNNKLKFCCLFLKFKVEISYHFLAEAFVEEGLEDFGRLALISVTFHNS